MATDCHCRGWILKDTTFQPGSICLRAEQEREKEEQERERGKERKRKKQTE